MHQWLPKTRKYQNPTNFFFGKLADIFPFLKSATVIE